MNKLILHIGHGKTGSTYLQSFLSLNIRNLKKKGVTYLNPDDIEVAKKGHVTSGNGHKFLNSENKILFKKNFLKKSNYLYSDETFFHRLINNPNFIEIMQGLGRNLRIILFTRNLFENEFAVWGQLIKRHNCKVSLNDYLINNGPSANYSKIIDWIIASKKYNCDLKVINYSNNKKQLVNVFLKQVIDNQYNQKLNLILPPVKVVNRSLTFTEYEIVRLLNNLNEKNNLADQLTNKFPKVKASKLFCNQYAYHNVKEKNIDNITEINSYLNGECLISIEKEDEVTLSDKNLQSDFISSAEIKIILEFMLNFFDQNNKLELVKKNKLVSNINVNFLRDMAVRIEEKKELYIEDALFLMNIAKQFRPEGPFINKKIKDWERIIFSNK